MLKEEKLGLLNKVFTPSSPIKERDFFFGRNRQVEKIKDAINTLGQHVILYGERGVGKTSLANIVSYIYTNIYPVKVTCEKTETFQSLWHRVFSGIQYSQMTNGIGFKPSVKEEMKTMAELYRGKEEENIIANIIEILIKRTEDKFLFVFDEFDQIDSEETRALFAQLIKTLSDSCPNITLVIVGVAENIGELLEEHQSVERCLKQVKLPKMNDEECLELVTSSMKKMEVIISSSVVKRIVGFSLGFPHYIHLICNLGVMERNHSVNPVLLALVFSKKLAKHSESS